MTLAEILAALNALPTEEHAPAITALQNDGGAVVKAFRSKVFADGKKEGKGDATKAGEELTTARERITELEGEVEELKGKTPDFAAKEQALKDKHAKELQKRDEDAAAGKAVLHKALRESARAKLRAAVIAKQADGTQVDPDFADDEYMARYDGLLLIDEKSAAQDVKQFGGETAYEAATLDEKLHLLAGDIRKDIAEKKPRYVLSDTDTGAGITNTTVGARGRSAYDPVKAGKDAAAAQKRETKDSNLARK